MEIIRTLLIGICIGMANVIPGVSGGTLAVVFNIYDKFVSAITLNFKKLWENRKFVIPMIGGMALGVLLFSKMITFLYSKFQIQTNYFFTGLIIGSIPMLFAYMMKKEEGENKRPVKKIIITAICALIGFAIMLVFAYLETKYSKSDVMDFSLPPLAVKLALITFFAGIVGAVAMIIPGISGSLLMLILGVYPVVIASIPALFNPHTFVHALLLLLPNGIGVLLGLLGGAKLVSWLIKTVPNYTYAVIFGLICGSIVNMFPGFAEINGALVAIACVICCIAGFAMAYFSSKFTAE